jgi:hypothetical protein
MPNCRILGAILVLSSLLSTLPAMAQCSFPSPYCGDSTCNSACGEDSFTCPFDCSQPGCTFCNPGSSCGDTSCEYWFGENRNTCPQDCTCGDGYCIAGEDSDYCPEDCASPWALRSANPFFYSTARDQYLGCWSIAGGDSSYCDGISDLNDRQICRAMSTRNQSPCTSMTDRDLQLACYGMSIAPYYPSNCDDIDNTIAYGLQNFCYSVSSGGTWANCSGVNNVPAENALCRALVSKNIGDCYSIGNANDRWFCYGIATQTSSFCAYIVY